MSILAVPANVAGELYVRLLSRAYMRGHRVYDPDYAHIQDTEAYEKIRRDPEIAHAMQYRRHLVAGREYLIEPATEDPQDIEAAHIVQQILQEIRRFSAARFNLSDAVFRGSAFARIYGQRVVRTYSDDKRPRTWWIPTHLRDMDRWRFRQVPIDAPYDSPLDAKIPYSHGLGTPSQFTARTRWEYWDADHSVWHPLTKEKRRNLVTHVYFDTETTLGYGRGLLEALYHFYWAKTVVMREGLQGIERWAQGWIVGELNGLRPGSTDRTNDAMVDTFVEQLEAMRSRHVMVHDIGENIEIKETSGSGHEIVMSFLTYLDQAMTKLILAGVLPTGGSSQFGTFAKAKVEAQSTSSLLQYDRDLLSEDLTHDLIGLIWRLNRPNLMAIGLGEATMPRLKIQHRVEKDPLEATKVAVWALNAGIPLRRDEVYAKIGYTPPLENDDVLQAGELPEDTASDRANREVEAESTDVDADQGKASDKRGRPMQGGPRESGMEIKKPRMDVTAGGGLGEKQKPSKRVHDERLRGRDSHEDRVRRELSAGSLENEELRALVYSAVREALDSVESEGPSHQ